MSELRCQYSGVPIQVARPQPGRAYFSCSGCAVASGIPVDAQGNFPINRTLIAVLGFGVVVFNQLLFWLLAVLLAARNREVAAERFVFASLAIGVALWLLLVILQWRVTGGGRRTDRVMVAITGALLATGVAVASPGCVAGAVLGLIAWGGRGLAHKRARH
jgi:hypothetical protein